MIAAVACYSIAYRFYSLFIARNIFELDDRRMTPAERLSDGLDYVLVQFENIAGDKQAVEAISDAVTGDSGYHQPDCVDVFAAAEGQHGESARAD